MIGDLQEPDQWTTSVLLPLSIVLIVVTICLALLSVCQSRSTKRRRKRNRCECMESNLLFVGDLEEQRLDENRNKVPRKRRRRGSGNDRGDHLMESDHSMNHLETEPDTNQLYNELTFERELSAGKFLSKYLARRHGMEVFVKIYRGERAKQLWLNEIDIYKIILIRHENILNFVAKSEFYDPLGQTHYLTVTGYHQWGSLETFLRSAPALTEPQMLGLMLSASSGLNHLHLEISSNQRKASIVHRNINAKNFIVKQNLTCALANFHYAIKSTDLDRITCECEHQGRNSKETTSSRCSEKDTTRSCEKICKEAASDEEDKKKDAKPCKRCKNLTICKIVSEPLVYCPPEFLDNSINLKSIVSLKSADTYSFGLVLWQVANYFYTGVYRVPFCRADERHENSHRRSYDTRRTVGDHRDAYDEAHEETNEEAHRQAHEETYEAHRQAHQETYEAYGPIEDAARSASRDCKDEDPAETRASRTYKAELKRLKYLLLERKTSDDLGIEEMFACHQDECLSPNARVSPNSSSSASSNASSNESPECLRSSKSECMIDGADASNVSFELQPIKEKRHLEMGRRVEIWQTGEETDETKSVGRLPVDESAGMHLPTKSELLRIVRESSYIEPLSRLSIRKIESDLSRLLNGPNG